MKRHPYFLAAVTLLLTAPAACSASGTGRQAAVTASASPTPSVSSRDRAWLVEAHQANLAEQQGGRLAEKKGSSAAVRRAGGTLVVDHGALDADVTQVAGVLGVELPRTAGSEHIADAKRLEKESGGRFDHDFVSTMIAGHKKVIADTEAEVREGSSPKVTGLARAALPTLHKHLNMLQTAAPTS
jgi:putative membrane protein